MNDHLANHNYSPYYESTDIESLWHYLKSTIEDATSLHVPKCKRSARNHPVWYTGEVRHKCNRIKFLQNKAHATPTVNNVLKLKSEELALSADLLIKS